MGDFAGGSTKGYPQQPARTLNQQILVALYDAFGRSGVSDVEVGWLNDEQPYQWWAKVNWNGTRFTSEHHADPVWALWEVAMQTLHGGTCTKCGKPVALGYLDFYEDGEWCDRALVRVAKDRMRFDPICEGSEDDPGVVSD